MLAGKSLNPSYSLCHPWSAAALYFAPRYLFGAHPVSPGWRQFAIDPIGAVGLSATGRVPTPCGPIHFEREEKRGRVVVRVRHPATLRPVISTTKARIIVEGTAHRHPIENG